MARARRGAVLLLVAVALGAVVGNEPKPKPPFNDCPTDIPHRTKPSVGVFVMSLCPDGMAAEDAFQPAMGQMGGNVDFEPHFVIFDRDAYVKEDAGNAAKCEGQHCSMHGVGELQEDVRQMCLLKLHKDKWWAYVKAFNKACADSKDTVPCSQAAAKAANVDYGELEGCRTSAVGAGLLQSEAALNQKLEIKGSPTVVVNDTPFLSDNLNPSPVATAQAADATHAMCLGFFPGSRPAECASFKCADDAVAGSAPLAYLSAGVPVAQMVQPGPASDAAGAPAGITPSLRAGIPVSPQQRALDNYDMAERCDGSEKDGECVRKSVPAVPPEASSSAPSQEDDSAWAWN